MAIGWGMDRITGPRGLRADQPPPNQGDDLHAIRVRYCGPKTLSAQVFNLATNQAIRFDLTGTPINGILLTTMTGQANGYFSDTTNNNDRPATTPGFVGTAGIVPNTEFIPLPPAADYIITLQEGAAAAGGATGSITFMYI